MAFLDCTGVRALAMAVSFAPAGCPVVVRSLSPMARRILELLHLDLENIPDLGADREPGDGLWDPVTSEQDLLRWSRAGARSAHAAVAAVLEPIRNAL